MKLRLARFLIRLHSKQWRRRFGAEYEILLLDLPLTLAAVTSSVWSAFDSRQLGGKLLLPIALALVMMTLLAFTVPRIPSHGNDMRIVTAHTVPPRNDCDVRQAFYRSWMFPETGPKVVCA